MLFDDGRGLAGPVVGAVGVGLVSVDVGGERVRAHRRGLDDARHRRRSAGREPADAAGQRALAFALSVAGGAANGANERKGLAAFYLGSTLRLGGSRQTPDIRRNDVTMCGVNFFGDP